MSIAEKLQTVAENQQKVYEKGKIDGNLLVYATHTNRLFYNAEFPDGYELVITAPKLTGLISEMFSNTKGIRKVTMDTPTGVNYTAYNFIYPNNSIEELVLPDGIHFTNWNYFATNNTALKSIYGRIDPSGISSNNNSFLGCTALVDISFVPGTIEGTINFSKSNLLSDASIQSIIDGLADLTGATTQTLTLHANIVLTDEQKATISSKNWTLVQ